MAIRIVLTFYFLALAFPGKTQSPWHLNKEKNGIKVYSRATDSSRFHSIKIEAVFDGTWEKLFAILVDVGHQNKWVYKTKRSHLIKKISKYELLYYTETELPWPMSNRDGAIRMKIFDSPSNIHRIVSLNEPGAIPLTPGLVRLAYYKAVWEVKSLEKNKIAITYLLDIHPGGGLPPWVVNTFITTGPYETFANLSELLKK